MDFMAKNVILKNNPNAIKKHYNLDKPGQMEEAINILREWVQKQNHFKKKDFDSYFYEKSILVCKGSIERSKIQIDKLCTMRTLMPQFFGDYNIKTDFGNLNEISYFLALPNLTDDLYRVVVVKFFDLVFKPSQYMDFFRANILLAEYIEINDYLLGFVMIIDFSEASLTEYLTKLNLIELKQAAAIFIEGYGLSLKAIHLITSSKFVDIFINIAKQILNPKLIGRIHIHKTIEEVREHIPKSTLPKDYGGEERSLKELQTEWIEALSSEQHMKHMRNINKAATDETLRQKYTFNEQYAGMPGTFRLLSVD